MPKPYQLQLKGYVGGPDFDRTVVDGVLKDNADTHVDVLIDSLGGSLATGLSVAASFKQHGDVAVHFVGLNASAATVASLGAQHISMDAGAMYLVHKASIPFMDWSMKNSDDLAALIEALGKAKEDLDKVDVNIATMYARKCRKEVGELLDLMKRGGWLSAREALDWGFVDELTDVEEDPTPEITDAVASAMASVGMPIPAIAIAQEDKQSAFGKFLASIASLFHGQPAAQTDTSALQARIAELEASLAKAQARIEELQALEAEQDEAEQQETSQVVDASGSKPEPTAMQAYLDHGTQARALFDSLP